MNRDTPFSPSRANNSRRGAREDGRIKYINLIITSLEEYHDFYLRSTSPKNENYLYSTRKSQNAYDTLYISFRDNHCH